MLSQTPHERVVPHVQIKEILVEESNVQPVNSPVTVRCGVLEDRQCLFLHLT